MRRVKHLKWSVACKNSSGVIDLDNCGDSLGSSVSRCCLAVANGHFHWCEKRPTRHSNNRSAGTSSALPTLIPEAFYVNVNVHTFPYESSDSGPQNPHSCSRAGHTSSHREAQLQLEKPEVRPYTPQWLKKHGKIAQNPTSVLSITSTLAPSSSIFSSSSSHSSGGGAPSCSIFSSPSRH